MIFRFITTALGVLGIIASIAHASPISNITSTIWNTTSSTSNTTSPNSNPGVGTSPQGVQTGKVPYWAVGTDVKGAAGLIVDTKDGSPAAAYMVSGSFILPDKGYAGHPGVSYSSASFGIQYGGDRYSLHETDGCGVSATVGAGVDMTVHDDGTVSFAAWTYLWDGQDRIDWVNDEQDFPFDMKIGDEIYIEIKKLSENSASVHIENRSNNLKYDTTRTRINKGLCQSHVGWTVTERADAVDKELILAHFGDVKFRDMSWVDDDGMPRYPTQDQEETGEFGKLYWLIFGAWTDMGKPEENLWQDARCSWSTVGDRTIGIECQRVCWHLVGYKGMCDRD
ncbi:hypothetical protein QBC40DRAFT_329485 [Triangularia verruculosa]|uniref:Uncharacterized protein n=1 Tax=Triangularia verruculosa TaxID=2587418 RepID=A0AAN7AUP5_9PEZI|nr:hypothetical protein QBC40DRAFT_329485 [Triangularia verruculosa]